MSVEQYRKRPIVVEAIQFDGENFDEIEQWTGNRVRRSKAWKDVYPFMDVHTSEGTMLVQINDWVIKEPFATGDRMFYPCKPTIFAQTYEQVIGMVIDG